MGDAAEASFLLCRRVMRTPSLGFSLRALALSVFVASLFAPYGCGSTENPGSGDGGANDGSVLGDGGGSDDGGGDGATTGTGGGGTVCGASGHACTTGVDCCTVSCVGGACSATQCVSDNKACTTDTECCSGTCAGAAGAKTCQALNTTCSTGGNACTGNDQCCSKLCSGGFCAIGSSYCTQTGDACSKSEDCCGGNCTIPQGKTVGTCSAVIGASFCSDGQDGTVCGDCNDCCSRLCAPYAPTGVRICQPANGCHVTGDLCRTDNDCCGGDADAGLPGAGNVTCDKSGGGPVGICRNPLSCNPEGNVCHYQNYACSISSARNDCCDHLGAKTDCTLDDVGVPRCHVVGNPEDGDAGIACRAQGQTCAFNGDCCNGARCIPGSNGELVCGAPAVDGGVACQPSGTACAVTADCCTGYTCNVPSGSTRGTCGTIGLPPGSDAGLNDGGTLSCAQYGQACGGAVTCCNNVSCISGTCHDAIK